MSIEPTPQGKRAQEIVRWVYEDIPGRLAQGTEQMRQLAMDSVGQARTEVQDAGTTLARLSSP